MSTPVTTLDDCGRGLACGCVLGLLLYSMVFAIVVALIALARWV